VSMVAAALEPRVGDGRFRRGDAEAEAFLQVEMGGVGVVVVVADREVLAGVEQEVAAAHAHNRGALHARGPDERSAEDRAQVVEQRVAAVSVSLLRVTSVDAFADGRGGFFGSLYAVCLRVGRSLCSHSVTVR
jgi:hypothetical protein